MQMHRSCTIMMKVWDYKLHVYRYYNIARSQHAILSMDGSVRFSHCLLNTVVNFFYLTVKGGEKFCPRFGEWFLSLIDTEKCILDEQGASELMSDPNF